MSEIQHLNTKYRLTEVDSGTKVFETTLEGDIGNVTLPTEQLRPDTKYKIDAFYTSDSEELNSMAPDGLLASVTFQTSGNKNLPPVGSNGKVDWNRHILNGTTLYEAIGGMEKLEGTGISPEQYEMMISRLMKSVEVIFRQKEPDNIEFPLKTDDKQNIIIMPVTIKTTRVIDGATGKDISGIFDGKFEWDDDKVIPEAPAPEIQDPGVVPEPEPFTPSPDTPLEDLDAETKRLMKWWSIKKPNIQENNAGITYINGHNGLLQVASFVKTDRYPGNHDKTEWQWSFSPTFEPVEFTTEDPKYRTHFNPGVTASGKWVYVRYRFKSTYVVRPLMSPWSDTIRYKTREYGIKDFTVLVDGKLRPTIQTSPFKALNAYVVGEINHDSTSYKVVRTDTGSTVYTLTRSKQYLTGLKLPEDLEEDKEYRVEVTYHADNALVEPKMSFYTFTTPATKIVSPEVKLEIDENFTTFKLIASPFTMEGNVEEHQSTTWKITLGTSTTIITEKIRDTVNKTELDITEFLPDGNQKSFIVEITYHTANYNSVTVLRSCQIPKHVKNQKLPFIIKLEPNTENKRLPKLTISNFRDDILNKAITATTLQIRPYTPSDTDGYSTSGGRSITLTGKFTQTPNVNNGETDGSLEYTFTEAEAEKIFIDKTLTTAVCVYLTMNISGLKESNLYIYQDKGLLYELGGINIDLTNPVRPIFTLDRTNKHPAEDWLIKDKRTTWIILESNNYLDNTAERPTIDDSYSLLDTSTSLKPNKYYYVYATVNDIKGNTYTSKSNLGTPDPLLFSNICGTQFYTNVPYIETPTFTFSPIIRYNNKEFDLPMHFSPISIKDSSNKEYTPSKTRLTIKRVIDSVVVLDTEFDYTRDIILKRKAVSTETVTNDINNVYLEYNVNYEFELSYTAEPGLVSDKFKENFNIPQAADPFVKPFSVNYTIHNSTFDGFDIECNITNNIEVAYHLDQTHTKTTVKILSGTSSSLYTEELTFDNLKHFHLTNDISNRLKLQKGYTLSLQIVVHGVDGVKPGIYHIPLHFERENLNVVPRRDGSVSTHTDSNDGRNIFVSSSSSNGDVPDHVVYELWSYENYYSLLAKRYTDLLNYEINPDEKVTGLEKNGVRFVNTYTITKHRTGNSLDHLKHEFTDLLTGSTYNIRVTYKYDQKQTTSGINIPASQTVSSFVAILMNNNRNIPINLSDYIDLKVSSWNAANGAGSSYLYIESRADAFYKTVYINGPAYLVSDMPYGPRYNKINIMDDSSSNRKKYCNWFYNYNKGIKYRTNYYLHFNIWFNSSDKHEKFEVTKSITTPAYVIDGNISIGSKTAMTSYVKINLAHDGKEERKWPVTTCNYKALQLADNLLKMNEIEEIKYDITYNATKDVGVKKLSYSNMFKGDIERNRLFLYKNGYFTQLSVLNHGREQYPSGTVDVSVTLKDGQVIKGQINID